ncbi:hypothetical protein ACW95P_04600 [Candidatus Mycoplasma pogonae]
MWKFLKTLNFIAIYIVFILSIVEAYAFFLGKENELLNNFYAFNGVVTIQSLIIIIFTIIVFYQKFQQNKAKRKVSMWSDPRFHYYICKKASGFKIFSFNFWFIFIMFFVFVLLVGLTVYSRLEQHLELLVSPFWLTYLIVLYCRVFFKEWCRIKIDSMEKEKNL